ncbi:hypothetical protein EXIGLDRAFT_733222, partial [Exidia glandulosa HHB12029]
MTRADSAAEPDVDAQRTALKDIRQRENFWRMLKVLFPVAPTNYPIVLDMLERWILLDEPKLERHDQIQADKRWDELCDAVDELSDAVDRKNRVSADAYGRFMLEATRCAWRWASYATGVPNDFNEEEYCWIALKEAADAVGGSLQQPPDLSAARARFAAHKATILEALGEKDDEREKTPPPPRVQGEFDAFLSRSKRSGRHSPLDESSNKRARVADNDSGEEEPLENEDELEDEDMDVPKSSSGSRRNLIKADAPFGVADGDLATKKCHRCEHAGVECVARLHKQSKRPAKCEYCARLGKPCYGVVWGPPVEEPAAVALHTVQASVDDLKASMESRLDGQAQEIKELKDMVQSLIQSINLRAR